MGLWLDISGLVLTEKGNANSILLDSNRSFSDRFIKQDDGGGSSVGVVLASCT